MKFKLFGILYLLLPLMALSQEKAPCFFYGRLFQVSDSIAITNAQIFAHSKPIPAGPIGAFISSAFSNSEGRFVLALKEASPYLSIVTAAGDTIHMTVDALNCSEIRNIYIQSPTIVLPTITLQAYRTSNRLNEIPASVALISSATLRENDRSSLLPALNTIPGVIMESRGYGGSHRLSIRGSSLRSPFAVRNIKLYLDGIPLTSADGQTPLELVDAADLQSIEIIKGPAGSMYGNGNGGVMLLKSTEVSNHEIRNSSAFQAASFGGYRWSNSSAIGFKTGSLRVSHNWQDYAGYREQEFNRKQQVSLFFKQRISERQRMSVYGTYYTGNWGLPGALNATQVDTMPQMAVPFSIANNAYLQRERYVGAITHEADWNKQFSERTVVSYQRTDKQNPYGTSAANSGYKQEHADAVCGRTEWSYMQSKNKFEWQALAGAEWINEQYSILEQTIAQSFPDVFKYNYDIGYHQLTSFLTGEIKYNRVFNIQGGYSYNTNTQFVRGRNKDGFLFDTTTTYGSQWLPRIAASVQLSKGLYLFHSITRGSANPTVFEMIDQSQNTYNLQLRAERGLSQELGLKQSSERLGLDYSLTVYQFDLKDAILPYTLSDGVQLYHNAGSTLQRGVEWSLQYEKELTKHKLHCRLWNSGSLNRYHFGNYEVNGVQLSGQSIPGVPLAQSSSGIALGNQRWSASITDYWFDRTPLNNANDTWSRAYHLVNAYASYSLPKFKSLQATLSVGINNALNAAYTSYYALNASAMKYYNPSVPRNFYAGIQIVQVIR